MSRRDSASSLKISRSQLQNLLRNENAIRCEIQSGSGMKKQEKRRCGKGAASVVAVSLSKECASGRTNLMPES